MCLKDKKPESLVFYRTPQFLIALCQQSFSEIGLWGGGGGGDRRSSCEFCVKKETREGLPLLTVETEANGDSKSTNERGPSLVSLLGLSRRYKRFLFCLGCSSRPSTTYFFPYRTLFKFSCPHRPAGSPFY
jgi:hypothetical protein